LLEPDVHRGLKSDLDPKAIPNNTQNTRIGRLLTNPQERRMNDTRAKRLIDTSLFTEAVPSSLF
jgi:hypothetical protein